MVLLKLGNKGFIDWILGGLIGKILLGVAAAAIGGYVIYRLTNAHVVKRLVKCERKVAKAGPARKYMKTCLKTAKKNEVRQDKCLGDYMRLMKREDLL